MQKFLDLLHREVVPAIGCTEPIAVALTAAFATETLGFEPEYLDVTVSGNLLKNGMGVMVPGTGEMGLKIAAAAGALGGKSSHNLECLAELTPSQAEAARKMVEDGKIRLQLADNNILLYCKVTSFGKGHNASAELKDSHSNLVSAWKDGEKIFEKKPEEPIESGSDESAWPLTLETIYEFASSAPAESIKFILDASQMNQAVAKEGLANKYGLGVGKSIEIQTKAHTLPEDLPTFAVKLTAAAADARMAGVMMPVMSNSGSGNQGITCTMPVVAYAIRLGKSDEDLARALIMSHLTAIHIKHHLGRLSAHCGAMVAATAAACGIAFLLGGSEKEMEMTVRNMVGNIAGMICDGAKSSCALKVASAVGAGIQAATLAMQGSTVPGHEGIVSDDIEACIANLGKLGSEGMRETDKVILDIMLNKKTTSNR